MKLSVVVPCYNEAQNIPKFIETCEQTIFQHVNQMELIFVNDGSTDQTEEILLNGMNQSPITIQYLAFSRNFGKEAAMLAGLQNATGEYVAIIDADLQQHPNYLVEMYYYLENHANVDSVTCYQEKRQENRLLSRLKRMFYATIKRMSSTNFTMDASDFRMFRQPVVQAICQLNEYHRFSKGIFSWVGYEVHYMPYKVEKRFDGESKWSFIHLLKYAKNGIIGFSTAPLTIAIYLGLFMTIISFFFLLYTVLNKLLNNVSIQGYTTIVSMILLLGGIQLIILGIIGEYLAQVFIQVKHRPHYIVKKHIKHDDTTTT